jgi:hypothetical protein
VSGRQAIEIIVTEPERDPGAVRAWKVATMVMWDVSLGVGGIVVGFFAFLAMVVAKQFWGVLVVWILISFAFSVRRATRAFGLGVVIGTLLMLVNLRDLASCLVIC